ncbi:unnamed protein product [Ambrosiozyma monospora]|uniref:Unnamed protein product n=1 Tax=Ambrosiozyma monospora TaxID=43982 RepID=A0A9W6YWD8_AMBMO|nr:unnamed protein product [Ambrosiozyma monospora]
MQGVNGEGQLLIQKVRTTTGNNNNDTTLPSGKELEALTLKTLRDYANSIDVSTKNEDGELKVKSILVTDILKHFESVQSVQTPALVTSKKRHLSDSFEIIAKRDGVMPEQAKRMTRSRRITSVVHHVPHKRLASVSEVSEISQESPVIEDEPNIRELMQIEDDKKVVTMTVGGIKMLIKEITDQVMEQLRRKENDKMKELEVKITTLETDNKELKTQVSEYQTQVSSNKKDTAKALVHRWAD